MRISVALATFNGAKFLANQIDSILPQLGPNDELIVSDNGSTDGTINLIERYRAMNAKIKLFRCKQRGVIQNFSNAISKCQNEIVFLSDQDDVWQEDKVKQVLHHFRDSDTGGVVHSCYICDSKLNVVGIRKPYSRNRFVKPGNIIWKNPVQGSCLAFRRSLIAPLLPIPDDTPMHDSWLGLAISAKANLFYLNEPLLYYRRHEDTVTTLHHKKIANMLHDRCQLLKQYRRLRK